MEGAVGSLRKRQRADGSFPGFWGINLTYATFFAVEGLRAAGVDHDDAGLRRAAEWLAGKQRPDGGWGEHFTSCLRGEYVEHTESQVAMTSWALLTLLESWPGHSQAIERGIEWLSARQEASGSWPDQSANGVCFGSAMLDYRLYKTYFPTWALARRSRVAVDRRSA